MRSNPKFSIIVPIFKVEKYLKKCIDSVLSQTYNDYELLLIDDGSPDSCPKICDEYQKQSKIIKVYHKKNGGLSDARNCGINNSKGDYLIFLDADDFWIDNDFLNNISQLIENNKKIDMILFNSIKYYEDRSEKKNPRFKIDSRFYKFDDQNRISYIIENNIYKACAWDKVVRSKIIKENNILFPINMLSEDMEWCGELLSHVENFSIYDKVVYAYRQREESISKSVSSKHIDDIIKQVNEGTKKENYIKKCYFANEYLLLMGYSYCASNSQLEIIREMSALLKYRLSKKVKIIYYLNRIIGFKTTCKLLNIYVKRGLK